MSIECENVGGINLAQRVCDTPVPIPQGAYYILADVAPRGFEGARLQPRRNSE